MHLVVIQVEQDSKTGDIGLKTSMDTEGAFSCDPLEKAIAEKLFNVTNAMVKHFGATMDARGAAIQAPGTPEFEAAMKRLM